MVPVCEYSVQYGHCNLGTSNGYLALFSPYLFIAVFVMPSSSIPRTHKSITHIYVKSHTHIKIWWLIRKNNKKRLS